MGPGTVNVVPHSRYPTKDGRWIAIACTNDKIFARLAEAMAEDGLPAPEPWAVLADRERDRAEVDAHVGAWTARHDRGGLIEIGSAHVRNPVSTAHLGCRRPLARHKHHAYQPHTT